MEEIIEAPLLSKGVSFSLASGALQLATEDKHLEARYWSFFWKVANDFTRFLLDKEKKRKKNLQNYNWAHPLYHFNPRTLYTTIRRKRNLKRKKTTKNNYWWPEEKNKEEKKTTDAALDCFVQSLVANWYCSTSSLHNRTTSLGCSLLFWKVLFLSFHILHQK